MGNAQRALAREGADGTLSFYANGEPGKNWEDLCAGPHVPSTGKLKSFKLLSLAGAYWHGDQNSDQLTRVYGTCFADKEGDYRLRRVLRTNLFVHNRAVAGSTPKVCPRAA